MNESVLSELASHKFLEGMTPAHLKILARNAREEKFRAGKFLLREGGEAGATFLILEGSVGLEIHGAHAVQLASVGPGDIVGWSWLSSPRRWHFDARARVATRALVLDGKKLLAACEKDPALGYALLRRFLPIVTRRLEAMRLQLADVYGKRDGAHPWA